MRVFFECQIVFVQFYCKRMVTGEMTFVFIPHRLITNQSYASRHVLRLCVMSGVFGYFVILSHLISLRILQYYFQ
jgi:hypothetical protein